jgi:hypothetical protein
MRSHNITYTYIDPPMLGVRTIKFPRRILYEMSRKFHDPFIVLEWF